MTTCGDGLPQAKITKKGGSANTCLDTLWEERHFLSSSTSFSLNILLDIPWICPNYLTVTSKQEESEYYCSHHAAYSRLSVGHISCSTAARLQAVIFSFTILQLFYCRGSAPAAACSTAVPVMQLQCCSLIWPWTCRPRELTQFNKQTTTHGNNVWWFEFGVWKSPKRIIPYIKSVIANPGNCPLTIYCMVFTYLLYGFH